MSKKLQNNGLWDSSRMMLPQHKEQLIQREILQNPQVQLPEKHLSNRDIEMIRQSIVLPLVLKIIDNKQHEVEQSALTLKLLYASAAKILALHLRKDINELKRELLAKDVRVFQNHQEEDTFSYHYIYRGHSHRIGVTRDYLKDAVSLSISHYINRLISMMQETIHH